MKDTINYDLRISKLLLGLGINGTSAYPYMKTALKFILGEDSDTFKLCVLYNKIAQVYGKDYTCIERCMRNGITIADNRKCLQNINSIYGFDVLTYKPTVGELLLILAEYLRNSEE